MRPSHIVLLPNTACRRHWTQQAKLRAVNKTGVEHWWGLCTQHLLHFLTNPVEWFLLSLVCQKRIHPSYLGRVSEWMGLTGVDMERQDTMLWCSKLSGDWSPSPQGLLPAPARQPICQSRAEDHCQELARQEIRGQIFIVWKCKVFICPTGWIF